MNKAVIFDLDGTLLDSIQDIADNINAMLMQFGYPQRRVDEIMQFIGNGARNLVKRSLPDTATGQEIDQRLEYYNKIYTESGCPLTKLFDGVKEVVETLKERGYKIAILTNKPQLATDRIYQRYMSELSIDLVVGQRDGVKIKPDPASALKILSEFSVEPKNAYFVGDGETDVLTAINGKMQSVAVLWGYRSKAQLEEAGAKIFVKTPLQLLDIIP